MVSFVGGDKVRMKELQNLMAFNFKGEMLTAFEDEKFLHLWKALQWKQGADSVPFEKWIEFKGKVGGVNDSTYSLRMSHRGRKSSSG